MPTIKVLIIEDNADIRESLRVLINGSEGYCCLQVFESAEDALSNHLHEDTKIVLMDINLPGMNGIDCMLNLRQNISAAQFMMFTIFDDDEHIYKALSSGASGYILKRTSPSKILEAITELYQGGAPMSAEIAKRVVLSLQKKSNISKEAEILTAREMEILNLLAEGALYKEIAEKLNVAVNTIKKHLYNVYQKLHVQNKTEAINKVFDRN